MALYNNADGRHELKTQQTQNAFGEKVVAPTGGIGIIDKTTGAMVPTTTRYVDNYGMVTPNYGGSGAYGFAGTSASRSGSPTWTDANGVTWRGTPSDTGVGASSLLGGTGGTGGAGGGGVDLSALRDKGRNAAQGAYQGAIDTALGGVDSARDAAAKSEAKITNVQGDLGAARQAAGGIGTAITNINASASRLNPYEQVFAGQGNSLLDVYRALMAGDAGVGGAVGDYLTATRDAASALDAINPDAYAAMAGADVRNSYDKALAAQNRELARRGVDVGSGASQSLMNQFSRALATAEASAMTRARMQGVSDRAEAQAAKQNLFKGVMDQAGTQSDKGLQATDYASQIVQKQGDLFSAAGSLGNTQTNAFANIGGVEVNLGNLDLSNEKLVQEAYQGVEAAQQAMAKFYQDTMDQESTETKLGDTVTKKVSYS